MRVNSDIDVLLVGHFSAEDMFLDGIGKIENIIQLDINYRFYSREEYYKKITSKDPFLVEILSDKFILIRGKL